MKLSLGILMSFSVLCTSMFGQVNDWRLYEPNVESKAQTEAEGSGNIIYHIDQRISKIDSLKKLNPTNREGYRVQIFFGNRDQAQAKRVEFMSAFPEIGAYISYLAPNFRLRVGDFRTRIESEKFKNEIMQKYPGCYIVKDQIELPALVLQTTE